MESTKRGDEMRFTLYRILGNDLPPRHSSDQTRRNLEFILEHEVCPTSCEKRFLLNRIVDPAKAERFRELIATAGCACEVIPFEPDEYRELTTTHERVHYLTNVNAARNYCIERGLTGKDFVLPFDGASFFRADGWDQFEIIADLNHKDPFLVLGQWRVENYEDPINLAEQHVLKEEYRFASGFTVMGLRELTIAFGEGHDVEFREDLTYGQVDKVEVLWRLGVPGPWDKWNPSIQVEALQNKSKHYGRCKLAGWVARLPSGNPEGDCDNLVRGRQRAEGLEKLVAQADDLVSSGTF